jgi:hypothetical protein
MKRLLSQYFILFFIAFIPSFCTAQLKVVKPKYYLIDSKNNADFNYRNIDSINNFPGGFKLMDSVFNVVNGKFTVYRFITRDSAFIYDESGVKSVNTLVLLKVNKKNYIIDGYRYFLENTEMPFTCNLYRISKNQMLINNLRLNSLRFKRVHKEINGYEVCDSKEFIKDAGIIKLK